MRTQNFSFGEFLSLFPKSKNCRAFEILFLYSKLVKNLNNYYEFKNQKIDFVLPLKIKILKKMLDADYPLSRLVGKTYFKNNELLIYSGVFIPRTETEVLVDITFQWINKLDLMSFSYLDACTGSGNIWISVLKEYNSRIYKSAAIDSSYLSCKNSLKNLKKTKLKGQVYLSNWTNFLNKYSKWEIITMNPPYICSGEKENINSLCKYEPKWALQANAGGWSHYQEIIKFAQKNLDWKLIILECSEFHEKLWDHVSLINTNFQVYKYRDHLEKFRVVVLIRL